MTFYTTTFETPLGRFSAAVNSQSAVVATAFGDSLALRRRLRCKTAAQFVADETRTAVVRRQVLAYFQSERAEFDVPLSADGSEFQQRVWAALRRIPVGETRSYAELAERLGSSPRAIGRANAWNPICLIVPCHRVIGKDGSLTGFAFGIRLKHRLLEHERAVRPTTAP